MFEFNSPAYVGSRAPTRLESGRTSSPFFVVVTVLVPVQVSCKSSGKLTDERAPHLLTKKPSCSS